MTTPCQRSLRILAALLDGPRPRARARALLARHGNLRRLVCASREAASPELTPDIRRRIHAALRLGREVLEPPSGSRLLSPVSVVRSCPRLWHATHEEIWVIAVDAQLRAVGRRRITRGGQENAATHAARILRPVIASGSERYFVLHNHPSGEVSPSAEDLAFTERLCALSKAMGVQLLDHLVVAGPRWHSCTTGVSGVWFDQDDRMREATREAC